MKQIFLLSTLSVILLLSLLSCIAEVKYPSVESVSISPEEITTLEIGQSQKFTATVLGENNPPKSVTWGVSGNNSSTTIIDTNGLLTVALDETSTALTVHAKSTFDPGVSGYANVSLLLPIIESIDISPNPVNTYQGGTQDFTAVVNGMYNPPQTVTWSVSGNNSTSTSINSSGQLTVSNNETSSSLVVQATSTYDLTKTGIANVVVSTVTSVVVSPNPVYIKLAGTRDFTAVVNGTNNPPQTVTWSLSGNNSSTTNISSNGRLTVGNNETATSLVVTATSIFDTSKSGNANVDVLIIGGLIPFGAYQWRVLDVQEGKVLIVSEDIIELRQYHHSLVSITWANCSLRAYLNNNFYYSSAFSNEDRARIVQVTNVNENNQWYGTNGGANTQDRIFLLSIAEVVQYFGDSGQLANRPPGAIWINDQFNSYRIATFNGIASFWWLRSPGYGTTYASLVHDGGRIYLTGNYVGSNTVGVRPALWLSF